MPIPTDILDSPENLSAKIEETKKTYDRLVAAKTKRDQLIQQRNTITTQIDSETQQLVSIWGQNWKEGMKADILLLNEFEKKSQEALGQA